MTQHFAHGRRARAYALWIVTTSAVLLLALLEWLAEHYVSDVSRAAGTAIEVAIVLVAALVFRPIHQRIDAAIDAAFTKREREQLAAAQRFRREIPSFNDVSQLFRRTIEAIEHCFDAEGCAIYLRREVYRAQASSFECDAADVELADPLVVRLTSTNAAAQLRALSSSAPGTHAFPMTVAGDVVGFLCVRGADGDFTGVQLQELGAIAASLASTLVALDPSLRPKTRTIANNIPADLPELVGRERELRELFALLEQSRLLTIAGPGGVGKTSVALSCAEKSIGQYEHGVWFIDLAPLNDAGLIVPAVCAALALSSSTGDVAQLLDFLRHRSALLVFDNCEHVISGVVPLIRKLLADCAGVHVIATSREVLRVEGERVYRLAPLRPQAAHELFVRRAAAAANDFEPNAHVAAIDRICEHLDGIPLALELAAARVRALSPSEIADRLNERFRLLTGSARDVLERQQTLAAAIEWSYDLLTDEEQSLLRRLSVFRGGFTLSAAAAVCAGPGPCDEYHVLDVLTSLVDKSLLTLNAGLTTRYRILESIREFARDKLIALHESHGAYDRHATYYCARASQAYLEFDTRMPRDWLAALAPDIDNFRAALKWTLEGGGDRLAGAQLAADCGPIFLRLTQLREGVRWCDAARSVGGLTSATAARIDYVASMFHNNLAENGQALQCAENAVSRYRVSSDERGLVRALSQIAQLYSRSHRFEDAIEPAREAIERARRLGEPRVLTAVLRRCAYALPSPQAERARAYFGEALEIARGMNDPEETSLVLQWWAQREKDRGNLERSLELLNEALEYADDDSTMFVENNIAGTLLLLGRIDEVGSHAKRALQLAARVKHEDIVSLSLAYWSATRASERPEEAAMIFGYARARSKTSPFGVENDDAFDSVLHAVETHVSRAHANSLYDEGARWTLERALGAVFST